MAEWNADRYIKLAETLQELKESKRVDLDWDDDQALKSAISIIEDAAPRVAGDYTIKHAVHIGDKEVVFGENKSPTEETPAYMVSYAETFYELGLSQYSDSMVGNNYFQVMRLFLERVEGQMQSIEKEQEKLGIPIELFADEQIVPNSRSSNFKDKLMVVRAEVLRPEYQNTAHQLVLAESGNGCSATARGSAVFTTTIATGKHQRFERRDFLGELRPECVPEWAAKAVKKYRLKRKASARGLQTNKEER